MTRRREASLLQAVLKICFAATIVPAVLAGCGGGAQRSESAGSEGQEKPSSPKQAAREQTSDAPAAPQGSGQTAIRTDAQGRKWIGNVPLDVWFDDPLGVAANSSQVASTSPSAPTPPQEPPMPTGTTEEPKTAASAQTDWESLIAAAVLEAEVKTIRNDLTRALQSLGQYQGNYKQIQSDGATLAALAGIAQKHPEPVSWKERSRYVRHVGTALNEKADALGREAFESSENVYLQLLSILDGSVPPDLPSDLPETVPPGEVVDRFGAMRRMDEAFQYLRKNINTEQALKSEKETVGHEAAILTGLAAVISDESFTSADEEEYATAAKGLIEAGLQMQRSAQADDFAGFSTALSNAEKRCNECHQGYRFADDF